MLSQANKTARFIAVGMKWKGSGVWEYLIQTQCYQALQALNEPASGKKVIVVQSLPLKTDWLQEILDAEREDHRKFFGREFDLAEFEKTLRKYGRKRIKMWQRLGMEPHFLPKVSMMFGIHYPGWKVEPGKMVL